MRADGSRGGQFAEIGDKAGILYGPHPHAQCPGDVGTGNITHVNRLIRFRVQGIQGAQKGLGVRFADTNLIREGEMGKKVKNAVVKQLCSDAAGARSEVSVAMYTLRKP